jgi:hypothetical protein
MKKLTWQESTPITNIISELPIDKIDIFMINLCAIIGKETEKGRIFRAAEILYDLYKIHDTDYMALYKRYKSTAKHKDKILLRYGKEGLLLYENKLKDRPEPENRYKGFSKDYWISMGMVESDAISKVSDIQSENAKRRTKLSYDNHSKKLKYSNDYWIEIGYTIEEAEILRIPYLVNMSQSLEGVILRYGEEKGLKKYISCNKTRSESLLAGMDSRRTGGYVSKESIRFFIPLYKFCRKLGIPREFIYFGIKGSKEFFIRDNSKSTNQGFFYDFTIQKIGIIIEYNGVLWHARTPEEWKNPFNDYQSSLVSDAYKQSIAEDRGMMYNIIWSDDNKEKKLQEYKELITNLWTQYESTKL